MQYHHVGIPTRGRFEGENDLPHLQMTVSDHTRNRFGIPWQRYWDEAPYPDLVKAVPHVAFRVENLEEALRGQKVIIAPNRPSPGVLVAFIEVDGAPVELLQVDGTLQRRFFQGVNATVALATLVLAGLQLVLGTLSPIYGSAGLPSIPVLDSNLRFFGGMGLALALLMLWALPTIERRHDVVAMFWACAFLGGVGRLLSVALVGLPSVPMVVFAIVEVVGAPLMFLWYRRLRSLSAVEDRR